MFKWIKNLFVSADAVTVPVESLPEVQVETAKPKKIEKVVEVEVAAVKATKASLSKLSKEKLEKFALDNYGVDIDRRKRKDKIVDQILKLSKKA